MATEMAGPTFGDDPDEVQRRLEQIAAQAEQKAQRYQSMQQQVAEISVSHRSADGAITVTVAASGNVTDLSLSGRIGQLRPDELATRILDCMRRAQSKLAGQVQEVMTATVGDDAVTVHAVVSGYAERFPEPAEEAVTARTGPEELRFDVANGEPAARPAAPARLRPVHDDDGDDWSDRSFLR